MRGPFGTRVKRTSIKKRWQISFWHVFMPLVAASLFTGGCNADSTLSMSVKTPARDRALRRLFDGAPPVVPHAPMGADCVSCHNAEGVAVAGLGFSPPSPHEATAGLSRMSRCEQCHVYAGDAPQFVQSRFVGVAQDLRAGSRLFAGAPPVMPHALIMRENCRACHSGAAAREEIRTDHPERVNCRQCHVEKISHDGFGQATGDHER